MLGKHQTPSCMDACPFQKLRFPFKPTPSKAEQCNYHNKTWQPKVLATWLIVLCDPCQRASSNNWRKSSLSSTVAHPHPGKSRGEAKLYARRGEAVAGLCRPTTSIEQKRLFLLFRRTPQNERNAVKHQINKKHLAISPKEQPSYT